MKSNPLIFLFVLFCIQMQAQDFVDITKLTFTSTERGNKASTTKTVVNSINFELTLPKVINEKKKLIFGIGMENTELRLQENDARRNLTSIRLNLGTKLQHSAKLAGTYMLLPKIASDFKQTSNKNVQFGALTILDFQLNESFKLKFGAYASTENFGVTLTPLIGFWQRSKNQKFYVNAVLPMRIDINYLLINKLNIGFEGSTSIKTYRTAMTSYAEEKSVRLAMYLSYGLFNKRLLLRGKFGFDTTDYGVYSSIDKTGFQFMAFPLSGYKRNRLNPEFLSNYYLGADLIFRLDLRK
jgi:hypothetical protein